MNFGSAALKDWLSAVHQQLRATQAAFIGMPSDPVEEIILLWIAIYGQPPPLKTDIPTMVGAMVSSLPTPTYERAEPGAAACGGENSPDELTRLPPFSLSKAS